MKEDPPEVKELIAGLLKQFIYLSPWAASQIARWVWDWVCGKQKE